MLSDLPLIATWWFVFFLLGLSFLPISLLLFSKFFDRGYIFSKIFGLAIVSLSVWFLSIFHLVSFSSFNPWPLILIFAVLNYALFFKRRELYSFPLLSSLSFFVFEEVLFFFSLMLFAFVRGFSPDIHGLEKYMDFGFINSVLRTDFFPPLDMWLSGSTVNYYYFGHYVTALLTKISYLDPAVSFNLMLASTFGFCFVGSFSIVANLVCMNNNTPFNKKAVFSVATIGFLGAFLVTLGGNLHTIYTFTKGYANDNPVPFWQILSGFNPSTYWYPNATRFIPYTIHEFPSYSFVVSDLHGHVIDISFVILTIALIISFAFSKRNFMLPVLGVLLGLMYMTNAWDGVIYLMVLGLIIAFTSFKGRIFDRSFMKDVVLKFLVVGIFYFLTTLPFNISFKPFVKGLFLVKDRSPLYMLFVLWGFFYFNVLSFLAIVVWPALKSYLAPKSTTSGSGSLVNTPSGLSFNLLGVRVSLAVERAISGFGVKLKTSDFVVLVLILVSTLLLIFPEIFYVKDIYPQHYRANTMFKLGYQAFIMLSIVSVYVFQRILSGIGFRKMVYFVFFAPLFFLVAIYPSFGFNSYYGSFKNYSGVNGVSYLSKLYPSDFAAISFLVNNVKGQPVILEAVGESYTDYARVSVHTGIPTVVGWPVHEWLWRGSYDEAGKRLEEVRKVYEGNSLNEVLPTLNKYGVEYIFVGQLEKQKYPMLSEGKFYEWGRVVFENGETKVFKKK